MTNRAITQIRGLDAATAHALSLIETLFARAADHARDENGCHDLDHSRRVFTLAMFIGSRMAARRDILAAAAILHDIGRPFETASRGAVCHAALGSEMAKPILADLGLAAGDIDAVCHAIATHRYRGDARPESLEAKILFDADKLDSIGATGIGRAFLFAGQVGARLHNPECDPTTTASYSREDTAWREFMVKLRLVKDRMLTPVGQELALDRHRFMELFFDRLTQETTGDLFA
jgi:uncharacterized protein